MNKKLLTIGGLIVIGLIALGAFLWLYIAPPDFMFKQYSSVESLAASAKLGDLAVVPINSDDGTFSQSKPYGWAGNISGSWTEITLDNPKDPSVKLVKGKNLAYIRVKEHTADNKFTLEILRLKPA